MINFKKAFLSPYMMLFWTGVLITISAYQLFQIHENTVYIEPDKVYNTKPIPTDENKVKPQLPKERN